MATALVGIGVLGLHSTSIALTRGSKMADSASVATALARQQLERLRSMPLGSPQQAAGNYDDAANPLRADGTAGGSFSRTWTVSAANVPSWGLRTVRVRVDWTDSQPHQVELAAYIRCATVPCPAP